MFCCDVYVSVFKSVKIRCNVIECVVIFNFSFSSYKTFNEYYTMILSDNWDRILEKEKKAQDTSCVDTEEEEDRIIKRISR